MPPGLYSLLSGLVSQGLSVEDSEAKKIRARLGMDQAVQEILTDVPSLKWLSRLGTGSCDGGGRQEHEHNYIYVGATRTQSRSHPESAHISQKLLRMRMASTGWTKANLDAVFVERRRCKAPWQNVCVLRDFLPAVHVHLLHTLRSTSRDCSHQFQRASEGQHLE